MPSSKQKKYLTESYAKFWQKKVADYGVDESCERLLKHFPAASLKGPVLDASIGTGEPMCRLLPFSDAQLFGTDLSLESLKRCRHDFPTVHVVCADVENLPFRNGSFQTVYCIRSTWYFENLTPSLDSLWNVTGPTGRLIFDYLELWNWLNFKEWLAFRWNRSIRARLINPIRRFFGMALHPTYVHEFAVPRWRISSWAQSHSHQGKLAVDSEDPRKPMILLARDS